MNKTLLLLVAFMAIVSLSVALKPPGFDGSEKMIKKGEVVRCIQDHNCATKDWRRKLMTPRLYKRIQSQSIEILIGVVANNADQIETSLYERSTPGSPKFRQWLGFEDIGILYKNHEAIAQIEQWIEASGAEKIETTPNGEFIRVRVAISVAEKMFNTKFHAYYSASLGELIVRTEIFYLPESIHPLVDVISGLTTFPMTLERQSYFFGSQLAYGDANGSVTPQLLNTYYGITSNTIQNTNNVTQSVFESLGQSFSPSDLSEFQKTFRIPPQAISKIIGPNTSGACSQNYNNCGEANLDVEYIIATAQGAPTTFWSIPNTNADIFLEWATAVASDPTPPIVHSISYLSVETEENPDAMSKFNTLVANFGQRGITVVVASGDDGVASFIARSDSSKCGFNPSFPASSPFVTAIGATQGPESGNPEIACSSSTGGLITTGGGFSDTFDAPAYQSSAISSYFSSGVKLPPKSDYSSTGRGYPDVALLGHNYLVYIGGEEYQESGTSASTPVFAGIISLANDQLFSALGTSLGFINPTLYALPSASFRDITSGENNCCAAPSDPVCCEYGFFATEGWDPLTGLGSTKFSTFIQNLIAGGSTTSSSSGRTSTGTTQSSTQSTTQSTTYTSATSTSATSASSQSSTQSTTYTSGTSTSYQSSSSSGSGSSGSSSASGSSYAKLF